MKNHDFTQKKAYFFPILGGGGGAGSPLDPPLVRDFELQYFTENQTVVDGATQLTNILQKVIDHDV